MKLFKHILLICIFVIGFSYSSSAFQTNTSSKQNVSGTVRISGSGTLYPLSEAVTNYFNELYPNAKANVSSDGTVAGFSIFINGESDITNASRSIMPSEVEKLRQNSIPFYELPVTYGAITILRNNNNDFAKDLTPEEVELIYKKNSPVDTWSDIRPDWPDKKIIVAGPKSTHGTYDFFQSKILGKDAPFRDDYDAYQDYVDIINKVRDNIYAIGYVGLANHNNHKDRTTTIALNYGDKIVEPTYVNVKHDKYKVLSRKMYVYVNANRKSKPAVSKFLDVYLSSASLYSKSIGFIPFSDDHYEKLWQRIQNGNTGLFTRTSSATSRR